MKRILILSAAWFMTALVLAAPAAAGMREGGVELGAFVFRTHFDNDSNVDDNEGFGGRLGILFSEGHELEFTWEHLSTDDEFFGADVDLDTLKAGYVYNFVPDSPVSPFITVGGGFQFIEIEAFGDEVTDPLAYGGGGVRFFIGNVLNFRLDAQVEAIFPDDDPDDTLLDGLLQAGVGWIIGGR